jgi:hypothetical protein
MAEDTKADTDEQTNVGGSAEDDSDVMCLLVIDEPDA